MTEYRGKTLTANIYPVKAANPSNSIRFPQNQGTLFLWLKMNPSGIKFISLREKINN